MPETPAQGDPGRGAVETAEARAIVRLKRWIDDWQELRDEISDLNTKIDRYEGADEPPYDQMVKDWKRRLQDAQQERENVVDAVQGVVSRNPGLRDNAVDLGFRQDLLPEREGRTPEQGEVATTQPRPQAEREAEAGGGATQRGGDRGGAGGRGGGEEQPNLLRQARGNRLLGEHGKEFTLVRGPKGTYVARYVFKVHGQTTRVGVRLGNDPDKLSRYGLKAADAKDLTREQMRRIKNIGHADQLAPHIRRGDKSVMTSLVRHLEVQYPKSVSGAILRNDEVMAKVIANSMFGWSPTEFEAQIKDTKWWQNTEPYQREWATSQSATQKRNAINRTLETVVNNLEDNFGLDWSKHVQGGMKKAREWAEKIASGAWGEPGIGLGYWQDRIFDRAAKIENTPAWVQEQQERNQFGNTIEEQFERLRSETINFLGEDAQNTPRLDRNTIQTWASDLVAGSKSEGDWAAFLRQTKKKLFPYGDENLAFIDEFAPYKSVLERIRGTPADWSDEYLRDFTHKDDNGKPTGSAMSLYDYEQYIRDNDPLFWKNPATEERGRAFGQEVLSLMGWS